MNLIDAVMLNDIRMVSNIMNERRQTLSDDLIQVAIFVAKNKGFVDMADMISNNVS
jgi:hypothetical protein